MQLIDDIDILRKLWTLFIVLAIGAAQDWLIRMAQQRMLKKALSVIRRLTLPPLGWGGGVPGIGPIGLLAPEGAFLVIINTGGVRRVRLDLPLNTGASLPDSLGFSE